LTTLHADAVRALVEPLERKLDVAEMLTRLIQHRRELRSFECDRLTLWVVLVVDRGRLRRGNESLEVTC
jgi:hypothetical protein